MTPLPPDYLAAAKVPSKLAKVPHGATCSHGRMRYVACTHCWPRVCHVECPSCGLSWMLYEGALG